MNAPQNTIAYDVDSGVVIVWNGDIKFEMWHLDESTRQFEYHSTIDAWFPIENSHEASAYAYANLYGYNPLNMKSRLLESLREGAR